jgi:transposase-like protein
MAEVVEFSQQESLSRNSVAEQLDLRSSSLFWWMR